MPDWSGDENKDCNYSIRYNHPRKKWEVEYWCEDQHVFMLPYFASIEAAQAAITTLGDELNVLLEGV